MPEHNSDDWPYDPDEYYLYNPYEITGEAWETPTEEEMDRIAGRAPGRNSGSGNSRSSGASENKLPRTLEEINDFVNEEGRFRGTAGRAHVQTVEDQWGWDSGKSNDVAIDNFGDSFESVLDAASHTLLGGQDIRDYVKSPTFTRLYFVLSDYIPRNTNQPISEVFTKAGVHVKDVEFMEKLINLPEAYRLALEAFDPRLREMFQQYTGVTQRRQQELLDDSDVDPGRQTFDEMMKSFSNENGDFLWAGSGRFKSPSDLLQDYFREHDRPNTPPPPTLPWEMRIGVSKFAVPPININVYQSFESGSLSGGAIRQMNTPKFNSGHSETLVEITLYYPNQESIWGYSGNTFSIDSSDASDQVLDTYLSSLRGLVTQFKYAPFLPLRNQYLNQVYDITAVGLKSMSVSTLENFPFCLAVTLTMQKFNHKVFLPTIRDFNQAIHWGRFRQYMIAAAFKMERIMNKGFLVEKGQRKTEGSYEASQQGKLFRPPGTYGAEHSIEWEQPETIYFSKNQQFDEGKNLEIYFPQRTPAKVFMAEYDMFRAEGEDGNPSDASGMWAQFVTELGYSPGSRDVAYEALKDQKLHGSDTDFVKSDADLLAEFLTSKEPGRKMTLSFMEDWREYYNSYPGNKDLDDSEKSKRIALVWFRKLYEDFVKRDILQQQQENKTNVAGEILLKEWAIPMSKINIDWSKVHITGVSTTLGNNFARLRLQMEEDPVLQHIGGMDSEINVNMVVFGESELIKWKRMFTHINGLAMLEHAHGVLGFLGIKNIVTALCGIKYVLPLDFNVETIPGYPRVYNVTMSFVDFDVEQQKREELSNAQQREFTKQFSKKNPFLRLKQVWGAFNAYPDFPLSITNDEGDIIGHLDPDYYFRAFDTYDDDLMKHHSGMGTQRRMDDIQSDIDEVNDIIRGVRSEGVPAALRDSLLEKRRKLVEERDATRYFEIIEQLENDGKGVPANIWSNVKPRLISERDEIIRRNDNYVFEKTGNVPSVTGQPPAGNITDAYADVHKVRWSMGVYGEEQEDINIVEIKGDKINLGKINKESKDYTTIVNGIEIQDSNPDRFIKHNFTDGLTPLADYQHAYMEGVNTPAGQYEQIVYDARYRDVTGRMIRAFPTYMLWLIDEGGRFAGYKLFDNFYGLQSVIDFSVVQSEDILGDTLIIRLSNLYKKLTTPTDNYYRFAEQGDDEGKTSYSVIDTILKDIPRNANSGMMDNYLVDLNKVRLRPGVRLHLRMGYGSNPNALTTVFNGVITEVIAGDIVEVVAQSDAIELSAVVNSTNEKGHSGKIDGAAFTGLWLSEPRDLMIRLLTMGTSQFREWLANANEGMIFSENKWGIRHFGAILYEPMGDDEKERWERYSQSVSESVGRETPVDPDVPMTDDALPTGADPMSTLMKGGQAAVRAGVISLTAGIYNGLETKRDYEIFKRNIYPGNGTGIAQYLGADALLGGDIIAGTPEDATLLMAGQMQENQREVEQIEVGDEVVNKVPLEDRATDRMITDAFAFSELHAYEISQSISGDKLRDFVNRTKKTHPILNALGITGDDEDIDGQDEVSFRASTYMKTIWDLFQTCAALLPNYIVAVRPFEDRSTVFYGKPHWLYTSGVIPLSLGVPNDGSQGPAEVERDKDFEAIISKMGDIANSLSDAEEQLRFLNTGAISMLNYQSGGGPPGAGYTGGKGTLTKDVEYDGKTYTLYFPNYDPQAGKNKLAVEMHLPTSGPHDQRPDLPEAYRWPFYEDKLKGVRGGEVWPLNKPGNDKSVLFESMNKEGEPGGFGLLPPDIEKYYCNFWWALSDVPKMAHKFKRVLITNLETQLSCVCAVAESGPGEDSQERGIIAGASPDTHMAIGNVDFHQGVPCEFSWLDDNAPLGPTVGGGASSVTAAAVDAMGGNGNLNLVERLVLRSLGASLSAAEKDKDLITTQAVSEKAKVYWETGWRDPEVNPWMRPWDSNYNDPGEDLNPADVIRSLPDSIYTDKDKIMDIINETLASDDENKPDNLHIRDVPFSPDPVAMAARRYYDPEYNERVSYFEFKLVEAGVPGFAYNYEAYSISNTMNFTGSGGGPLEEGRGETAANRIWAQFKLQWYFFPHSTGDVDYSDITGDSFKKKYDDTERDGYRPEIKREELIAVFEEFRMPGFAPPNGGDPIRPPSSLLPDPMQFSVTRDNEDNFIEGGIVANEQEFRRAFNKSINFAWESLREFMKFMWQHPYARAWLVITTNGDPGMDIVGNSNSNDYHFNNSPVVNAFKHYLTIRDDSRHPITEWSEAFSAIATSTEGLNPVQASMLTWLQQHNTKGGDVGGIDDKIRETAEDLGASIKKIWHAVAIGFSGLFGLFEAALGNYGEGLERMLAMQKRTNILNAAYNDSIYYAAGAPGSLTRLVDNPFTREYGEPVVEVREPFQRLHYVNSFQHIIDNQISENLDSVYTTITATSDGNYPITVFFDKGSPPERQVEGFVETGLYWDNAQGSGFFSFLHPALHPIEWLRGISKIAGGSSDELSSKRIGIYHLKESLKDIYMGELTILGNADIRPWDLVYIGDVFERMYGLFEVEQVVHHFTPETGFITSITPNAITVANDPSRWSALSWLSSWMGVKNIRDDVRNMMITRATESSPLMKGEMTVYDLVSALQPQISGQTQYTHGSSAMMKDLAGHFASGQAYAEGITGDEKAAVSDASTIGAGLAAGIGGNFPIWGAFQNMGWDAWQWVRDTLADQQDCYILYLSKDGQPMDAGLSYNQGVAVGNFHSYTLLPGILGFDYDTKKDGHTRITIEDLFSKLGYKERDILSIRRNASLWTSRVNSRILQIAGSGPDDDLPFSKGFKTWAGKVTKVTDGDTIDVDGKSVRFAGIDTAEMGGYYGDLIDHLPADHVGARAQRYLEQRLLGRIVAVRESLVQDANTFGRVVGVIFHNTPEPPPGSPAMSDEQKAEYLLRLASSDPAIPWDSYLDDGRPYTINWEMIMMGFSSINFPVLSTSRNDPSRGASGNNSVEG